MTYICNWGLMYVRIINAMCQLVNIPVLSASICSPCARAVLGARQLTQWASEARSLATPDVARTRVEGMGEAPPAPGKFPGVCSDERGEEGVGQKWEDGKAPQVRCFLDEMLPG